MNKLNRRRFIKAGGTGLAGLALLPHLESMALSQTAESSPRRVYALDHGWLFNEKALPGSTRAGFNDVAFKRVTIPHTNKLLPWHGFDDQGVSVRFGVSPPFPFTCGGCRTPRVCRFRWRDDGGHGLD